MDEDDESLFAQDPYEVWRRFREAADLTNPDINGKAVFGIFRKQYHLPFAECCGRKFGCDGILGGIPAKPRNPVTHPGTGMQRSFNRATCHHLMCPSCWTVSQIQMGKRIESVEAPYWYLRATHEVPWPPVDNDPTPAPQFTERLVKRFRAHGSVYRLVCWSVALEASEDCWPVGVNVQGESVLQKTWRVHSRLVGLFVSDRRVGTPTGNRSHGLKQMDDGGLFDEKGEYIGAITRQEFDNRYEAMAAWCEMNPHPAAMQRAAPAPFVAEAARALPGALKAAGIKQFRQVPTDPLHLA